MSAAVNLLHLAIEDAVQQLEPQLLPLFGGGAPTRREGGAREPAAPRPTQRTHAALKMLVALTRFFPEDHRVRRAGEQLELIWPPLVLEPRGAAAGKLLHCYFRLRQDLLDTPEQALRRAMQEELRTAIDSAAASGNYARIKACDARMRCLSHFLPAGSVDIAQLETLGPLARLFRWQQLLDAHAGAAESDASSRLLLPDMLAVLDRCIALCRSSDWSLDHFCNSGLARGLWQLRGMARFMRSAPMALQIEELEDECLDMHLTGAAPPDNAIQQWLARLFAVVHDRNSVSAAGPAPSAPPELPFRALYDEELAKYRRQLQAELQCELDGLPVEATAQPQPLRVSAPLITLLYKLTWVFAAAERQDWARLCHCAYRVALQFWRLRRPVSAACEAVLQKLALQPGAHVEGALLRQWRWQLLQDWPNSGGNNRRPIALRPEGGHVVALDAVPDLLSASFTALVQAGRLAELPSASACQPYFQVLVQDLASELLQELALLEKGAAAMKVWPLEQLCTLLLAVYEIHLRDEVELPASLLQDAHRHLVRMLDQSAAWREAQPAPALVQALEAWLRDQGEAQSACREPQGTSLVDGGDCEQTLRAYLLSCIGTLAAVLERPVRLQLDVGAVRLDAMRMMQVVDCLRPLIKFMLLDQSVDTRTRQSMHKPRISTLAVTLRATSATLAITASEDSHEEVLGAAELQRLQRRLPKGAGPLVCESRAGRGRSFTFTLD
jgi:hypothetical protein